MTVRKLGRGRLDASLRARVGGDDQTLELTHELKLLALSRKERSDLARYLGVQPQRLPRALYECKYCGSLWAHKDRHEATSEWCQSRMART